jgi:protein-tyrosine phosphatase
MPRVLRDVGGPPVAAGGTIATGLLFRISGQLVSATELDELRVAGVVAIVDLRAVDEDRRLVERWAAAHGVSYAHEPINAAGFAQLVELARTGGTRAQAHETMLATYRYVVDEHGPQLANTLALLAHGVPAGFGCAAGRDRTGIVASLLYDLLGVPDDAIHATYAAAAPSPDQLRPMARQHFGLAPGEPLPEAVEALLTVRPEWIAATLEHVRSRYGGVAPYLYQHGLPDDAPERLRQLLVAPAAPAAM